MKNLLLTAAAALLVAMLACTPKTGGKMASAPTPPPEPTHFDSLGKPDPNAQDMEDEGEKPAEYAFLDEAVVKPDSEANSDTLAPYNPSHTFESDLIHTKLELSFDWEKKHANGKATLTVRPWFYATDKLTLDAKNFDIKSVTYEGKTEQLKYKYDNAQLVIDLGKTMSRNDEYKVVITYTAKPDERESFGGSAAITNDKGLYFINADGSDPEKPRQIWTQGETESNSFWFPTVDKPNERCTQEMYLTVEDKYKTLSNGVLVSSKKNADGTRTDYWKMDKPHAPYLFMMAIGDFAVVTDKWRGIDVQYYMEPKYKDLARDIYPYTPEMLEFFSTKLNYTYPWPKLALVAVRDYVSGAMENTTAIIFGEYVQGDKRMLIDNHLNNEKVVAHEMFHHWFGDLVTTESWANLTLNEGFANYSEYLWLEHKYGADEADFHEMQERQGYIFSAAGGGHPLIDFGYEDREAMFDAHSYNKGGAILHMLRKQVGDDAFFAALSRYLKRNEYSDVEAHELRLAFEDVTGQDLNWFFNQWFFGSGHPMLDISYSWNESDKTASVTLAQTQPAGNGVPHVFNLPLPVDIYDASGNVRHENIRMTKRTQTFTFPAAQKPALINVDADRALLGVKNDQHSPEEWIFMYRHAPLFADRFAALEALETVKTPEAEAVFTSALSDKFWVLRNVALNHISNVNAGDVLGNPDEPPAEPVAPKPIQDPQALNAIAKMAESDPSSEVRSTAINELGKTGDKKYVAILNKGLGPDQSYSVVGAALAALSQMDPKAAIEASKALEKDENEQIVLALANLYAEHPDKAQAAWFATHAEKMDNMVAFAFFDNYQKFLLGLNDGALLDQTIQKWRSIAFDQKTSQWRRFSATKSIADIRNHFREQNSNEAKVAELDKMIEEIKAQETDPTLKLYYGMF